MWTKLYWVNGPWPGRLALSSRPRGGEWLADEMSAWSRSGVDTVASLLTKEEEIDLDIVNEAANAQSAGMTFLSFPIYDRCVPASEAEFAEAIGKLEGELKAGRTVVLHCRQGIGRTGLVAACLLVAAGVPPETAMARVSSARGVETPETADQRRWVDAFAESLAAPR